MTNLVLTRKAGQSVRLMVNGNPIFLDVLKVSGGDCEFRLGNLIHRARFRGEMQIADGVSVLVVDLAKGHAKLNFTAPREVQILRTELIKEGEV